MVLFLVMPPKIKNMNLSYTPKEYDAYIDLLTLNLVRDLKSGKIDEEVFSDTYARYQKMKIDNANNYAKLDAAMREFIDQVTHELLNSRKDSISIEAMQAELADLREKNKALQLRVSELETKVYQYERDRLISPTSPFTPPFPNPFPTPWIT